MTLCPYAIVAGCARCPIVRVCPAKGVIGDHAPQAKAATPARGAGAAEKRVPKRQAKASKRR